MILEKSENKKRKVYAWIVFLVAAFIYFPTTSYEYTFDDIIHIEKNDYVNSTENTASQVLSHFAKPTYPGDLYRPIVNISFRLTHVAFGSNPFMYHVTNVLLHAIASVLVFFLIYYILNSVNVSFLIGLIFAVHPIHIEAVANIFGRNELFTAVFGITSILLYRKYFINSKKRYLILLAPIFYFLSMLCKESGVLFFALIPLYLLYLFPLKENKKLYIKLFSINTLFLVIYLVLRFYVLKDSFVMYAGENEPYYPENPLFTYGFVDRVIPSIYIFGEYLSLLTLPLKFSIDYSLPHDYFWSLMSSWIVYWSIFRVAIFLALLYFFRKSKASLWFIWVIISFSLTVNFFVAIGTIMGERLAYLPSVGFLALLVILFAKLSVKLKKQKIFLLLFILYFIFNCVQSFNRTPIWKNNNTLFDQGVIDNVMSPKIAAARGYNYFVQQDYQNALDSFKEGIFRDPTMAEYVKYIIDCHIKLGEYEKALYWTDKYDKVLPEDEIITKYKIGIKKLLLLKTKK